MITERDYRNILATARYDGFAAGLVEGEAKGLAEGESRGKADVAKAMLSLGLSEDMILQAGNGADRGGTGWSEEGPALSWKAYKTEPVYTGEVPSLSRLMRWREESEHLCTLSFRPTGGSGEICGTFQADFSTACCALRSK